MRILSRTVGPTISVIRKLKIDNSKRADSLLLFNKVYLKAENCENGIIYA